MKYFPLFADLRGRRVLVVGGGEVAERKIRLLLDAGALVDVVARNLTEWLQERTADRSAGAAAGTGQAYAPGAAAQPEGSSLRWIALEFQEAHLHGAVLTVAATDDAALNAKVASAARGAGLLANVVDDAERSGFIVPAIIDRSPLVIAVSTGGAAPVLARLVRERIECLIDESVGRLASLLERWRSRIRAAVPDVTQRRRFYESAVRGEVARWVRSGRPAQAEQRLRRELERGEEVARGSVVLVGAGPGDPGLLTLNALRALQDADVILHDRLVSDDVLTLARRDAARIEVGKRGRGRSVPQATIHQLMLEHARQGRRVVRLKGGDPFIFGRGGEELEFLAAHGVPFEVVPGVTAAIACGAYAGIPLTHRDHAQSVRFVTAHDHEQFSPSDWAALAIEGQTLCLYMGIAEIAEFGARLVAHGRSGDTPVAIVEHGSRREQRVTLASLDALQDVAARARIESPAMVIVGEVAALADELSWFGEAPRHWEALRHVA